MERIGRINADLIKRKEWERVPNIFRDKRIGRIKKTGLGTRIERPPATRGPSQGGQGLSGSSLRIKRRFFHFADQSQNTDEYNHT